MLFISHPLLLRETHLEQWPLRQYSRNVFNCFFVLFYVSMPYKAYSFLSLFLFPETIPSGVCYKSMRLKDERLNSGWEPRGYADLEILNPFWASHFFFLLHTNITTTQMVLSFFISYRNNMSGTALARWWEGRDKYYVTVIVLLRKKCIFYSQFIC